MSKRCIYAPVSQILYFFKHAAADKSLQSCLTLRPHRRQPIRLPDPGILQAKNTGVGCHFLLQCMKMKSESEVAQSSPTLRDPLDCSAPGSSVHGILQARVLEWGAIILLKKIYTSGYGGSFLLHTGFVSLRWMGFSCCSGLSSCGTQTTPDTY